jgi:regulator of sigma E protease
MITALIFIIVLGVLVLVHEWGHFIMARRAGMKVEEFGFGFPPRIWGIKKGETTYTINAIPFGGFVKIYGEDGEDKDNPRSFGSKPFWPRFKVIIAGVVMNLILAVFLLMLGNFFGLRIGLFDDATASIATDKRVQIIQVAPDSPASESGLMLLDEIVGFDINGERSLNISSITQIQEYIQGNLGQEIEMVIRRGNEEVVKMLVPRINVPEGEGAIGVSMALTGIVSYPWYESIWRGVYNAFIILINTAVGYYTFIKTLIFDGKLMAEVSGPIGIANITGQAARVGINYLMQFVALISINLAILNIIPFPALDGGRALFLIIEKLKGSPIPKKFEAAANATGFSLLIALMIYVTIKDIFKFL